MFALAMAETKTAVHRASLVRRVVPTIRERFFSSIDRDMKDRDAAAEAAYIHERDLQALRALSKKMRDVHAKQHGYDGAAEEIKALKSHVPETSGFSADALGRLLDWKHDVLGNTRGSTMGV